MTREIPSNLFVLEMANNHMGSVAHGLEVIRQFGAVCRKYAEFKFAFKLQYRELDTFVHPSMKGRLDVKYIKRFEETRLTRQQFGELVAEIRKQGFLSMATPFDNESVDVIEAQNLDIIKIASCSFTDWPLLERVAKADSPIIASTAGASLADIDRVVSFLSHRNKAFAILHCVGEYPTPDERLNINQIDTLKARYPDLRIGFSTHEDPANTDIVKLAVAKGVDLFEKHVGVATQEHPINAYSATPHQVDAWLTAARYAQKVCGTATRNPNANKAELDSLRALRRGAFVRRPVRAGQVLGADDVYFAFPPEEAQFTANDWSKYARFVARADISADGAVGPNNTELKDERETVWLIAQRVKELIQKSGIVVPGGIDLEVSHHYGLERFDDVGLTMLTVVNRGYCKKILVSLPGQKHPEQYHKQKEETFHVLYGEVELTLDGKSKICRPGDVVNVEPGVRHAFHSTTGCVIEEISSTHFKNDSFYTDEKIQQNKNRKTLLTYWMG
jgi:sialic acid synthase SpsE/mannose-6-phosphate isomerase-like protein (cupin superfamily)